jgi:hypothetical protein
MPYSVHCKKRGRMIFTKCSHAIANHISPDAAWVFGVIEYWSTANARKKNPKSLKNGLYCMFMSLPAFQKELPFIKRSALQAALQTLRDQGIVASFEGDANSSRAKYYTVDQEGLLKFQYWSSGYILSARDGRALTPIDEQVPDADPEVSYPVAPQQLDDPILLPANRYPVAHQQHILLPANRMPHTLDIKSKYKDVTKSIVADVVGAASRRPRKKAEDKPAGSVVWDAYRSAYLQRYNCEPIRNAAINSICKRLHEAVGDESVVLVQHYVSMNKRFYLEKSHPLSTCLADIQAIKTAYMTGKTMTYQQVKELENRQTAKETADEVQQSNGELASAWARIDTKRTIKI